MDSRQPRPWPQLAAAAATLAVMMWLEMPDWQRQAVKAKTLARLRKITAALARRTGHAAMGDELAGRPDAARAGYGLAYRLSMLRDRL